MVKPTQNELHIPGLDILRASAVERFGREALGLAQLTSTIVDVREPISQQQINNAEDILVGEFGDSHTVVELYPSDTSTSLVHVVPIRF